jgi:eight-cysteine-cluster-containing protein
MSRTCKASVFFCLFAVLAGACPDSGENPDSAEQAGAGAGAGTTTGNQVIGAAGAKAVGGSPAAGSGVRAGAPAAPSVAGKSGGAGSSAAAGQSAGAGQSGSAPEDDAGVIDRPMSKDCVVGGCSNQLCTDAANGPVISTCEWREEYGCYRDATCARQSNGQCGWTQTPELMQCVGNGRP